MTAKKQITIDVPDGLPDGWECVGYGRPGRNVMVHTSFGWCDGLGYRDELVYLIARRTETAADWANKQPKLTILASMVVPSCRLEIYGDGSCLLRADMGISLIVHVERFDGKYVGKSIVSRSGKWVNA